MGSYGCGWDGEDNNCRGSSLMTLTYSQSLIFVKVKYILRQKDDLEWSVYIWLKQLKDERLWVCLINYVYHLCSSAVLKIQLSWDKRFTWKLKGLETSFLSTRCKYNCSLSVCFSHKQQETSIVCEPLHMFIHTRV